MKINLSFVLTCSVVGWVSASPCTFAYFEGNPLLIDPSLTHGINVFSACDPGKDDCRTKPAYYLANPYYGTGSPSWHLSQWGSRADLPATVHCGTFDGPGCKWNHEYKRLILYQDGRIELAVNGENEWGGIYKTATNSSWPTFLLEQVISKDDGSGSALPLDQVSELRLDLDVRLTYMNQNNREGSHDKTSYNKDLHSAIFPLYVFIQNLLPGDPEHGKYLALGVAIYDDREAKPPTSPPAVGVDAGLGILIYTPAYEAFASISVQDGGWVHFGADLMPYAKAAVQEAVRRGIFRSGDLSKFKVVSMNVGWELTGLNIGTMQFKNLSLRQFTAQNPKSYEFNRDADREGWVLAHSIGEWTRGPQAGIWILTPGKDDPQLLSPLLEIDTSVVKKIIIRMANDHQPDGGFQLFWAPDSAGSFTEDASKSVTISTDGGWGEYTLDLSAHPKWTGTVRRFRIDPVHTGNGSGFGIDYIRFSN